MRRAFRLRPRSRDSRTEVEREIRFHLEMRTREFEEAGLSGVAARRAALAAFGDVAAVRRECLAIREQRRRARGRAAVFRGLGQDLRLAARALTRSPGFTAAALLTLALGIGANAAVFGLSYGILIAPLPFHHGSEIVRLEQRLQAGAHGSAGFSPVEIADYRTAGETLADLVEYHGMAFVLLGHGDPQRVQTGVVSARFFQVLGVDPYLGRLFLPGEDAPGADPVLLLGHAFWRRNFGADPTVIGRRVQMNDREHRVVGVLPPLPRYPGDADIYVPASACPFRSGPFWSTQRAARGLALFARLRAEQTLASARQDLARIGALRLRLFRQLFAESALLTVGAGAVGLAICTLGLTLLEPTIGRLTPWAGDAAVHGPALVYTMAASFVAAAVVGVPALGGARCRSTDLRVADMAARLRARTVLAVAQVAIAFVLLIVAGLFLRSFLRLRAVDPWFTHLNVVIARVDLNWSGYSSATDIRRFVIAVEHGLRATPGVSAVAVSRSVPLAGPAPNAFRFRLDGGRDAPSQAWPVAQFESVSPEYFAAVGIPAMRGRTFTPKEYANGETVVVINEAMAHRFWPREDPVGRRIWPDNGEERWHTIVGVVGDAREHRLDAEPGPLLYANFGHNTQRDLRLIVRGSAQPGVLEALLRRAVHTVDSTQPVSEIETLVALRDRSLAGPRLITLVLAFFATVALVTAAPGIAGVMGYAVSRRTREIGVRLALGAKPRAVVLLVLRQTATPVALGLALGAAGSLALARAGADLLFGVSPADPATFAAASLLLVLAGLAAGLIPARRAAAVDPANVLRAE
jgi:hypothetical protein